MATSAVLRIILGKNDSSKVTLPLGIPGSVDELKSEIQRQYLSTNSPSLSSRDTGLDEINSISSVDTDILSSSESSSSSSSLRREPWPDTFPVPEFVYDVEIQLQRANSDFQSNGTLFSPSPRVKSDILECLASQILKYKAYPSSADFDAVAEALVKKHPCLREQGSVTGFYGWKISLKYKMANYRTKLRNIGCAELNVNSLKRQSGGQGTSPNQVKKPRRAEVNYYPNYPTGQSQESLEEERRALLSEVTKSNNQQVVKEKMERTFAYRRQEVIKDKPFIAEFKRRWPALFSEREVEAEFTRITTVPLRSKFMEQLDHYSSKLMTVFQKKGGAAGQQIRNIMADLDKNESVETRRACILRALIVYLNEDPENLIREYLDVDDNHETMEQTVLGVFAIKKEGAEPADDLEYVGIIIEGVEVLHDLGNVANALAMLFGLMYSLDLSYPTNLRYTFEVLQKLVMELDGNSLSTKAQVLKKKLLEGRL